MKGIKSKIHIIRIHASRITASSDENKEHAFALQKVRGRVRTTQKKMENIRHKCRIFLHLFLFPEEKF